MGVTAYSLRSGSGGKAWGHISTINNCIDGREFGHGRRNQSQARPAFSGRFKAVLHDPLESALMINRYIQSRFKDSERIGAIATE
jgi:hypothetical protein